MCFFIILSCFVMLAIWFLLFFLSGGLLFFHLPCWFLLCTSMKIWNPFSLSHSSISLHFLSELSYQHTSVRICITPKHFYPEPCHLLLAWIYMSTGIFTWISSRPLKLPESKTELVTFSSVSDLPPIYC